MYTRTYHVKHWLKVVQANTENRIPENIIEMMSEELEGMEINEYTIRDVLNRKKLSMLYTNIYLIYYKLTGEKMYEFTDEEERKILEAFDRIDAKFRVRYVEEFVKISIDLIRAD